MKILKITSVLLFLLFVSTSDCFAQDPPPMAMPKNDNKNLIDKIIEVTNYDAYFKNYCETKISETAKEEKWSAEKIKETKQKINLDNFKFTIYNLFAKYSKEQLNDLIENYKNDKSSKTKNLIVESPMVEKNLKSYTKNLVGGYK